MPGLISSAAPGKRAAPKAPARRRPAPNGLPPTPSVEATPTNATSIPPPTPPPTQLPEASASSSVAQSGSVTKQPTDQQNHAEPARQQAPLRVPDQPEQAVEISAVTRQNNEQPVSADASVLHGKSDVAAASHAKRATQESAAPEPDQTLQYYVDQNSVEPHAHNESHAESTPPAPTRTIPRTRKRVRVEEPQGSDKVPDKRLKKASAKTKETSTTEAQNVKATSAAPAATRRTRRLTPKAGAPLAAEIPARKSTSARPVSTDKAKRSSVRNKAIGQVEAGAEESPSAGQRPTKKAMRSSARSNASVQAELHTADSSTTASAPKTRAKRSSAKVKAVPQADDATGPEITIDANAGAITNGEPTQAQDEQAMKRPTRKSAQKKTSTKAKSKAVIANSDDETEMMHSPEPTTGETGNKEAPRKRSKPNRRRKRARPEHAGSEVEGLEREDQEQDEAELHEIDPNTLSMYALSYDAKHGKTSELGRKMAEIDWDEIARKRREEAERIATGGAQAVGDGVVQSIEQPERASRNSQTEPAEPDERRDGTEPDEAPGGSADLEDTSNAEPTGQKEVAKGTKAASPAHGTAASTTAPSGGDTTNGGLGFAVDADGNIVLNEDTVNVDREAVAHAAVSGGQPIEEINDLTSHLNRTSWLNSNRRDPKDRVPAWRSKSDPWSEEETDRFYEALQMFGTDFFIISKMFPPKTRRMIKAKFTREERIDPQRMNAVLTGKSTKTMDLEHYSRETGRDVSVFTRYQGIEHAQSIINEAMKEKQEAMTSEAQAAAAAAEKEAEERRQKFLEGKNKRKTKSKKKAKGGTLGGAPEEVTAEA